MLKLLVRFSLKKNNWENIPCAAHLLQTSIRHCLQSSAVVQKLIASSRRLVGQFKHSSQATELLLAKQIQMGEKQPLRVVQDVATRWNSAFDMLSRLMKLRLPLTALLTDPSQKRYGQAMLLKDSQWLLAFQLIETLRPLKEATTVFGGQKYVTVSLVLPVVGSLIDMYSKEDDDSCLGSIVSFRRQLCRELTTNFRLQRRLRSSTAVIASALDPRFRRLQFVEHLPFTAEDL